MKLLFAFALALFPILASGQSPRPRPENVYLKAFQYIKSDSEYLRMRGNSNCVAVFDSIVHQNQLIFLDELGKQWGYTGYKKENRLLDSLETVDRLTYHKPYYSAVTASLTRASGSQKGCMVIMFSRLHNNMLLAEVSDNGEDGTGRNHIISTFDQSLLYLIVFGADGKVQQHYTKILSYN
ncbi:hypothetical protein HMJ29_18155 [Hymenobacter taeanensis]|uniref:Uncharacterized protein n=1 Tax=Hymenobacter taeanensis TaxID=2735321 RepID=A0A6M6BNY3_9BACT|nr:MULTISPECIES: hypothetical protein [Hymenobacter]QJX48735.1 hypothetical protein HMJ29_18155 [Hymenobacter taeanensis]UOQ81762.1 hypothetical protein MUN83_02930 [Hymenobacter sp. 5414T-23]